MRTVPLTGTDQYRILFAASSLLKDNELHTTKDQVRVFLQNNFVGPSIWHGDIDDEAAMILINTTSGRGCFPSDLCNRLDTESIWMCISNRGESADDWVEFGAGGGDVGWSPVLAIVTDDERRVLQVTEWTGGTGTPPDSPVYIGADGFTDVLADAVDIRGQAGADGADGGGGGGGGDTVTSEIREVLAETILGSDGDIDWTSLTSTGYDYFDLVLNLRGNYSGAALEGLKILFNGDSTAAHYASVYSQYNGTSRFEGAFSDSGPSHMVADGETAGYFTTVLLRIMDPGSTTRYKNVHGTATSLHWIEMRSVTWNDVSALTRINLVGTDSTHFKAGSFARLVGVRKVDISTGGGGGSVDIRDVWLLG